MFTPTPSHYLRWISSDSFVKLDGPFPYGVRRMKRNDRLILLFSFLGPLVGGLSVTLPVAALLVIYDRAQIVSDHWIPGVIVAYVVGIVPASITAFLTIAATSRLATSFPRILAASALGFVVSLLSLLLLSFAQTSRFPMPYGPDPVPLALTAAVVFGWPGGISALVCMTLVELLHPLPKVPVTPTP